MSTNTEATAEDPVTRHLTLSVFGQNSLWLWIDRGALRVGTLLAGLVLIRHLGPASYGIYTAAISTGAIVNILTDFGLTRYGARAGAVSSREIRLVLASSLLITGMLFAIELAVFCRASMWGRTYSAALAAGLILTNFEGTSTLCSALLTSALRSKAVLPASLISAFGTIAVILLAAWRHFPVVTILALMALKSIIAFAVRLAPLREWWPTRQWPTFGEIVGTVRQGWPYFSYSVTEVAFSQLPVLCLGFVAGRIELGLFAAANVVANVFPQWLFASSDALLPIITRMYEARDLARSSIMMQRVAELFVTVTVAVAILLSTLAPMICQLMGGQFRSSAHILSIAAFTCVFTAIGTLMGSVYLTGANRVRQRRNAFAVCVLGTLVLVLLFGHFSGGAGAAVALLIGNIAIDLAYFHLCRGGGLRFSVSPLSRTLLAGVIAIAAEVAGARFLHSPLGLSAIALVTYAIGLIAACPAVLERAWGTLLECASVDQEKQISENPTYY